MSVGDSGKRTRRRRLLVCVAAVVVVSAIGGIGFGTDWFGGSDSGDTSGRLVKNDPKALAAAVVAHLPYGVSVTWASGTGKLGRQAGPGSNLEGDLSDFLLLKWDNHQYLLAVEVSTNPAGTGLPSMNSTKYRDDSEGRLLSIFATHWFSDHMVEVSEFADPSGAGDMPLQQSDLQRIVHDSLVSMQTTEGAFEDSRNLASYRTKMPVVKWFMNPNYGS